MRKNLPMMVWQLCLPVLVVWLSGCAGGPYRLVDRGRIDLENRASGNVFVAWSDVHEEQDGLLVTGVLKRRDTVGRPIKARVEVEVVSTTGSILDTAQSDAIYVPHRKVNRIPGFQRFRVRLSSRPPAGACVRVTAGTG
jgi:hypothetical protein